MSLALTIHTAPIQPSQERKESCLHVINKQACGLPARVIENEDGEGLGTLCPLGHLISKMKRARKKCEGCGSRIKGRHGTACYVASDLIEKAIELATDWQEDADCEEDWASIQEEIEEVLSFGDSRIGGPLR